MHLCNENSVFGDDAVDDVYVLGKQRHVDIWWRNVRRVGCVWRHVLHRFHS